MPVDGRRGAGNLFDHVIGDRVRSSALWGRGVTCLTPPVPYGPELVHHVAYHPGGQVGAPQDSPGPFDESQGRLGQPVRSIEELSAERERFGSQPSDLFMALFDAMCEVRNLVMAL
jgi:hypothetical protein